MLIASPAAAAPAAAAVRAAKACGAIHAADHRIDIRVDRGHTACRRARRQIRARYNGKGTPQRGIFSAGTGSCIKHPKTEFTTARDRVIGTIPPGR